MNSNGSKSVKQVLIEARGLIAPGGVASYSVDRAALEARLDSVRKRNRAEHLLWIAILAIAFIAIVSIVLWYINDPKHAAALIAASGIGLGGIMARLWQVEQELTRCDVLLALVSSLSETNIAAVVTVLAGKL